MVQLNRVNWELTCVEFLLVEGVFHLARIFYLLVFRTVGHISPGKPVRIELRGSDTAHPETGSLHLVGTDGGVHGAEIEFTILAGFDITAYKYPDKFLGIVEGRYLTQPGQQFVDSALLLLHRHMAVVDPELLGLGLRIDLDPLAPLEIVDRQIIGRREREFVVSGHTPGIQPLRSRHHLELDDGIVLRLDTGTVVQFLVILFEIHVLDIVEVNVARHIQLDLLDEIGRIALGHIDMPRKTKRLGVERDKTQIDAVHPVDGNRVEQIIFVKRGTDVGQGAHKAVVQQRDVVPENIDFAEQVVAQHLHALLVEYLVDAGPLDTGHNRLLGLGAAAVVVLGNLLLDRNREDRLARDLRRVDIVEYKLEFLEQPLLLLLLRKVVEGKSHLLVFLVIEKVVTLGVAHVAPLDQLLDKLHRGVILLAVLLLLGLHHHLLQAYSPTAPNRPPDCSRHPS